MSHDVPTQALGELANIVVRCADGRVYDLGKPTDRTHRLKVFRYRFARRHELAAVGIDWRTGTTKEVR